MIDLGNLDNQWFKAFYWAARELNFTAAAKKAGMTQSGVSQHVAKIEAALGASVFERVNKQVHLTRAGELLLELIEVQVEATARFREALTHETRALEGAVRYAMPHSCLFTPHFPLLLQDRQKAFPGVSLDVTLCPNEEVVAKLLNRQVDFGFVTKKCDTPGVKEELFARESYQLFGVKSRHQAQAKRLSADVIAELHFVDYPGMSVLFEIWRETHFPRARTLGFGSLEIAGRINSLHGAITMVLEGLGCTIMPSHCAEPWLSRGKLVRLCAEKPLVESDIYIATREEGWIPARVGRAIDAFRQMKQTV